MRVPHGSDAGSALDTPHRPGQRGAMRRPATASRALAVAALAVATFVLATPAAGAAPARATAPARPAAATTTPVPALKHVFTIVLENYSAEEVTPQLAPYLSGLMSQGVTLDQMYGVDHFSLTNYIAMTSGNAANANTKLDCLTVAYSSCIYTPPDDTNIGDQMELTGHTWKAYLESMPAPCTHPNVVGAKDTYLVGYATRHNPFVYYQDVVGTDITTTPARCVAHDVPYTDFATDLAAQALPNYALIVPNTCDDAHDRGTSCSLSTADTWLSQNVPQILSSPEYQDHGALFITFDESDVTDARGCCGNAQGGHIATVVLSPLVGTPGAHTAVPYSHYSLLRTIEDGFGLPCLRHACDAGSQPLGNDVWATGQEVTTGYTATEAPWLTTVQNRIGGPLDQVQHKAVSGLAFVTGASGKPGPQPVNPPPGTTGPTSVTTGWGPSELPLLQSMEQYFALNAAQVQKLAVQFWAYLIGMSG